MLVQYSNGELTGPLWDSIVAHLKLCVECRVELVRLQEVSPADTSMLDSVLGNILSGIRQSEAERALPGMAAEVRRRVGAEVRPFLGPQATNSLLASVLPGEENLLSAVEPILALFLGNRAASHFVGHVVDRAILRS